MTNVDKKLLEIEFWVAICCQSGDKWQSKTLILAIFDPRSLIVKSVLDCRLSSVVSEFTFSRFMSINTSKTEIKS